MISNNFAILSKLYWMTKHISSATLDVRWDALMLNNKFIIVILLSQKVLMIIAIIQG